MSKIAYGIWWHLNVTEQDVKSVSQIKRVNILNNKLHLEPWFAHQNIQQKDRQMETYRDSQNYTEEIHREANIHKKIYSDRQITKGGQMLCILTSFQVHLKAGRTTSFCMPTSIEE